jgi:hypothetical protein
LKPILAWVAGTWRHLAADSAAWEVLARQAGQGARSQCRIGETCCENGAVVNDPAGTHFVGIWHRTLWWAVDELTRLNAADLAHLRVRSGEHIAAILLTAFLRRAPAAIDVDGGIDLLFDLAEQPADMRTTVNLAEARIGDSHLTMVKSAEDIIRSALPSVRSAASALDRKSEPTWSRNAFIVVHPFDDLAIEMVNDEILASALPPLADASDLGLRTVWVLWVPDHLTMWSVVEERWTEMNFRGVNPTEDLETDLDGLAVLQRAEARFLQEVGSEHNSPYIFRLTSE